MHSSLSREHQRRFEALYESGATPWDTGRPQSTIVRLCEAGRIQAPVIDLGCGTGATTLFLARSGYAVVGVDFSAVAIRIAKGFAAPSLPLRFLVSDILSLGPFDPAFNTLVDIGTLHTIPPVHLPTYVAQMARLLASGGRAFVMCFSEDAPPKFEHRFSRLDLETLFDRDWRVSEIEQVAFDASTPGLRPVGPPAWLVCLSKRG